MQQTKRPVRRTLLLGVVATLAALAIIVTVTNAFDYVWQLAPGETAQVDCSSDQIRIAPQSINEVVVECVSETAPVPTATNPPPTATLPPPTATNPPPTATNTPIPVATNTPPAGCGGAQFESVNGLVVIEVESQPPASNWQLRTDINGYTGNGYYQWVGSNNFNVPGRGTLTYLIKINETGDYRIQWRSRIATGSSTTDHNDNWLRFNDADEYYAQNGNSIVYPYGSGQTPNPNGAGSGNWFKVYMNQLGNWSWISRTSDNNPHDIYARFDSPGVYTMEISARSAGHAIDRVVMYNDSVNTSTATNTSQPQTLCGQ